MNDPRSNLATAPTLARQQLATWSVPEERPESSPSNATAASLFVVLFALWFLMSGHTELWLLGAGAICSGLTVWISLRLKVVDREGHPVHLLGRGIPYAGWLLVEIIKANLSVARVILFNPAAVDPKMVRVKPSQRTDLGRVVHANSITLTPGTITVEVDPDGTFTVHALHAEGRNGLKDGSMDRRVSRLMGEE